MLTLVFCSVSSTTSVASSSGFEIAPEPPAAFFAFFSRS